MKKIISFFGENSPIFDELNKRAAVYAEQAGLEYIWAPQTPFIQEDVILHLKSADAGIIDIQTYDESIFKEITGRTKMLVRFGVGYDKVNLVDASKYHIAIARTTGANASGVAEMAITLLLASRRQLFETSKCVYTGKWQKIIADETLNTATIGIVGFGLIGQKVAGFMRALGCQVLAYDPFADEEVAGEQGVELTEIKDLFSRADAISVHAAYSKETHHLVNETMLNLMKPTAVIVNTARGAIIDEEALYEALAARRIRAAGLDVYSIEPLPLESRLLQLDNVILTPHLSSQTTESLWNTYIMAIDIAADFFNGKMSPHILNPDFSAGSQPR